MKIVMIRSNPVSPYPRLEKTANSLCKAGHQIQVLAWDRAANYFQKGEELKLANCSVPINRFGIKSEFGAGLRKNLIPLVRFQIRLVHWLIKNRNDYDVIHAYDFDTGFAVWMCSRLLRKKIIYDIPDYYVDSHGLKGTNIGKIVLKLENAVINHSDATIICTEKRIEQIAGTTPKRLVIIHNSPTANIEITRPNISDIESTDNIKIAYIGILAKGRFLKEILKVVASRTDCELHIGGFGELEEYVKNFANHNERIFYYGKLLYRDTLFLESQCDVITAIYDPANPNHNYAAPNKFYEALMLGKPLIMVKNTGMDIIVKEHDIGEIIDFSIESFDEAISRLINRKSEWKSISNRAKNLYDRDYSWRIMEKRLINLYRDI